MLTPDTSHSLADLTSAIVRTPLMVEPETMVRDAIAQMSGVRTVCSTLRTDQEQLEDLHLEARSSCVLVVKDGKILGILTERDIVRLSIQKRSLDNLKIKEVMASPVATLRQSEFKDLFSIVNLFQQNHIRHLPIVDEQEQVVGLLTHESLRQILRPADLLRLRIVAEVMTSKVICAPPNASMLKIARLMAHHKISSVMIIISEMDSKRKLLKMPLGIVTERDMVQFQALNLDLETCQAHSVMSTPIFSVSPLDSLLMVQKIMEQRWIRRLAVTGSKGELLGIVTQSNLLQSLNPLELYKLASVLEQRVLRLEAEKMELLQNRTIELEKEVQKQIFELRTKAEREQLINHLSRQIRSSLDLPEILDTTVKEVQKILNCSRVVIWQFQADWTAMVVAEFSKEKQDLNKGKQVYDPCFADWVEQYQNGRIRVVDDIYTTEMSDCHREFLEKLQVRAKILVPIVQAEKLWGVVAASESDTPRQWQLEEVDLLQQLAIHLAIAIKQATAYQQLQTELVQRQKAEEALSQLNSSLASRVEERTQELLKLTGLQHIILESTNYSVISTDLKGIIQTFNLGAQQMLGYTPDEVIGKVTPEIIHDRVEVEQRAKILSEKLQTTIKPGFEVFVVSAREGLVSEEEWTYTRKDGSSFPVLLSITALRDLQGEMIGFLGIAKDITQRKQTDEKLSKTLEELSNFKYALEQSMIVAITDAKGVITYANDKLCQISQYSREELIGRTHRLLNSGYHPREFFTQMWQTITQGKIWRGEIQNRAKDNSLYWVDTTIVPYLNAQGKPFQYLAFRNDITDRKWAGEQLRNVSDRLTLAIQSGAIGIWEWDIVQNLIFGDSRTYELYNIEQSNTKITNQFWINELHPDDQAAAFVEYQTLLQGHKELDAEFRILLSNGNIRYIKAHAMLGRNEQGQPLRIIGINYDITDRKQTEFRLQQQAEREKLLGSITKRIRSSLNLEEILNTTVEEVYQVLQTDRVLIYRLLPDRTGTAIAESVASYWLKLLNTNLPAEIILEEKYEQYLKGKIYILNDRDKEPVLPNLKQFLKTIQVRAKLAVPIIENQKLWGLLVAHQCSSTRHWKDWEIDLLQQIAIQLTIAIQQANLFEKLEQELGERKKAETKLTESNQKLAISNEELARATRLKDEFLANMSHELRTPLNAILGMSEALQEEVFGPIEERQQRALKTIEQSGTHLLELINDILDLAKIESGQMTLHCSSIEISELCHSSITFVKQQAFQKRIRLEVKIEPNLPPLFLDERRIRQVLINLLNNAIKFTQVEGSVTLEVTYQQSISSIRIAVIDTGIGISPEDIKKLFKPFVQIDSALNRQYMGTGLGLSLVKRMVEMQGGKVGVTSQVGVGSCFTIDIPCNVLSCPLPEYHIKTTTELNLTYSKIADRSPLILLTEDNEANISTMSSYLTAKGYRIITARSGQEAIDLASKELPDLILMDIQMPGMDGLEATKQIRCDPLLLDIPIIALTALAMQGDKERCLEAGANEYLSKPVKLSQLSNAIQQFLTKKDHNK